MSHLLLKKSAFPPYKKNTHQRGASESRLYHPGVCVRGKVAEVLFLPAAAVVLRTFPGNTNPEKKQHFSCFYLKDSVNQILMRLYLKVVGIKGLRRYYFLFSYL